MCVTAEGTVEDLRDQLGALLDLDGYERRGAVQITSLSDVYDPGDQVDPSWQVQAYAAAAEAALADGYTGFRVVAEATPLVRTDRQLDAFTVYEHLVDRYMRDHPFSAMCAYRRSELPESVAELACMNPVARDGSTLFHLYAAEGADLGVAGEIDLSAHDRLQRALDRAEPDTTGRPLIVDATRLTYIDHTGLFLLRDHARRHGTGLVLRTANIGPARLVEVLDVEDVTVVRLC